MLYPATASAERYRFRHYGLDEGLNTAISVILQDRTGFLWVGTGNGLFRYDGARFQRFGVEDGLPNSSIRSVHESADGGLWVATGGGLARLRHDRFESVDLGIPGQSLDLHALASGGGKIYVGLNQGLFMGRLGTSGSPGFHPAPGVPKAPVWGIQVDPGGAVWFSSGMRLCLLERGEIRVFDEARGLPPQRWGAMLRDREGNLWVRGPQRMFVLPAGATQFVSRDLGLPQSSNTILTLASDSRGTVMVATDQGLARWIDGKWQLTGTAQGLESDSVTAVYEDREHSLWIGMWGAGLARWPGSGKYTNWTMAEGLTSNLIWAIRRDAAGSVWVGTDRGLLRMNSGVPGRTWTQKDGLGGDKVKTLAIAPDGAVWAGSAPGGISRLDPVTGSIRTYGRKSGLEDDRVIAIHIDSGKRLWASTGDGLFRSTGLGADLRFERQILPGSPERTMFFRFLADHSGGLWVGSSQALYRWDGSSWAHFTQANGLKSNAVSHIAETRDGAIWIGYRQPGGLSRLTFRKGRLEIEHVAGNDHLPSDFVLFLGLDSTGRLWVGTDNGVVVKEGDRWTLHTHEDGLVWDDCASNAFFAEPDGTVWIGTMKGLSRYRPILNAASPAPPPPVIRSVRFGERSADPSASPVVSYHNRDFSVAFSALSFLTEKHIRFRYRLVGLDDRWVETTLREIRYASLPPGSYRFEVAARNANSDWSNQPAAVAFSVEPAWWGTWWFRILTAGALTGLLWMALRARDGQMVRERKRLENAVRERTRELELQKDVEERQKREIQDLLRQSEEVSRLKSEFLANMSHEIRTPMNGVIAMTQLVLATQLDGEQREYITTVRDSADALLVVINDILDFSKIEAGKLELVSHRFSLRKCVTDALQMFSWKATEKGIDLSHQIRSDVPEMIMGDADRLRQILLNLVANAMKFTDQGGVILRVTVEEVVESKELRFSVRDTGAGIPLDKQESIFEAFEQADGSHTRRKGGTGLGLAICSKLVQLMQGRIWVESAPDRGSTFSFTLPFEPAGAMEPGPDTDDSSGVNAVSEFAVARSAAPLRILLAEDNAVNQLVARRMIEKMGHSLVVVEDGRQAVQTAVGGHFDLILMDVQMPEMDGIEASALIRKAEREAAILTGQKPAHVPIVAVTAHAMSGDREHYLNAGMDDYISKPIGVRAMVDTIERVRLRFQPVHLPEG